MEKSRLANAHTRARWRYNSPIIRSSVGPPAALFDLAGTDYETTTHALKVQSPGYDQLVHTAGFSFAWCLLGGPKDSPVCVAASQVTSASS